MAEPSAVWTKKFLLSDAFTSFLNMLPHAVIFSTEAGEIILTNLAAQRLFQYSEAELLHCHIEDLVPPKSRTVHPELRASFFKDPKPRDIDGYRRGLAAVKKDGSEFPMDSALFTLKTKSKLLAVNIIRDISKQKKDREAIEAYAFIDALTGLPNRRYFDDHLKRNGARARRQEDVLSVFFIDFDKLKIINDTYGHAAGDFALRIISARLSHIIRSDDVLARIGRDEFALILFPMKDPEYLPNIARRFLEACQKPIVTEKYSFSISASIGIAADASKQLNEQALFKKADQAMYKAKKKGGNCFIYATKP